MGTENISLANNFLYGMRFRTWLRVLRENRFAVSGRYWHRALAVTAAGLANSAACRLERARFPEPREDVTRMLPPLFILGHWRTGTTWLHYMLARDPALAAPNTFQVMNPGAFLLTERLFAPLMDRLLPRKRPMDDMALSARSPAEDEFAMALETGMSPYLGLSFPANRESYARYLTFEGAPASETDRWRASFRRFAAKLARLHPGRRLVFKSPAHTARVPLLLDLFPGAKFVHIHRDPYAVFQSSRHIFRTLFPYMFLQRPDWDAVDEDILRRFDAVYAAWFRDRGRIPQGDLHEIRFADLERDPLGELERLYAALGLPGWHAARPSLAAYAAGLGSYRKNAFAPLDAATRDLVRARWEPWFRALGYPA